MVRRETDTRGRQEELPYPWSQQVIHETSGLVDGDSFSPAISWHHSCIFVMVELSSYSLFNGTCLFISSLTLLAQTNFGATLVGGEH